MRTHQFEQYLINLSLDMNEKIKDFNEGIQSMDTKDLYNRHKNLVSIFSSMANICHTSLYAVLCIHSSKNQIKNINKKNRDTK